MSRDTIDEDRLVRYLLGLMPEEEKTEMEDMYLTDDVLNEQLQAAERELIDRYIDGDLSGTERKRFESFFLCSPARMEKLRFARALRTYGSKVSANYERAGVVKKHLPVMVTWSASPYFRVAALVALAAVAGVVFWRVALAPAPEAEAMLALAKAYEKGRLFESRISGLSHMPMAQARGEASESIDQTKLREAELIAVKEVSDRPGERSFHTLGRVFLAQKRFDDAIDLLLAAVEANPQDARIHSDLGAALMERGRQNANPDQRAQDTTLSLDHLDRAIQLDDSLLEARFNRALWYEYHHQPDRAKDEWRSYLERDPDSPWAEEARRSLTRLEEQKSSYLNKERDFDEFVVAAAEGHAAAAWRMLSRNRDRSGNRIVQRLIDEYLEYTESDKPVEAGARLGLLVLAGRLEQENARDRFTSDLAAYYSKATVAQRKMVAESRGLLKSAFKYYKNAGFEQAMRLCRQAGNLFAQAGDYCEAAVAESWLAACCLRAPDIAQALSIIERLTEFSLRRSYRLLLAQSLSNQVDAQTSMGEFSKALDNADRSREIYESLQDVSGTLRILQAPVLMSQQFGDFHEAIGFGLRGLDVAASFSPGPMEVWPFYAHLASNLNSVGRPVQALLFAESALRLATEAGAPMLKCRSYALLGLIYLKLNRYEDAVSNGDLALAEERYVKDEQGKTDIIAHSTLILAHIHREIGDFSQALSYYDRAIEMHRQMNLLIYVAEANSGKLQTLIGLNDERAIEEQIKTSINLLEQDRLRILEDGNRNRYFDLAQSTYDIAADFAYSRSNDTRVAFEYSEGSRARSLLDLMHAGGRVVAGREGPALRVKGLAQPLNLAEIQRRLPERCRVLQYSVLENNLISWLISKHAVETTRQAVTVAELTEQVTAFVNAITKTTERNRQEELSERGQRLYQLLIAPIKAHLPADDVLFIIPDKVLNYVPFGALVCPESGRYFIEERAFEIAPSSTIMIRCSERVAKRVRRVDEKVLAVGNPTFDHARFPSLPDLPAASREAASVAALYNSSYLLTGQEAHVQNVKARMHEADVIHIASHHVADERSPLQSRLLLASGAGGRYGNADGTLSASQICDMTLGRAPLVVLSACGTGIERYYRGEGAVGIARPFIEVGAPLVIASLWPVQSEQTSELMIDFHRQRKVEGLSTVRALRQSQLDMLNSRDPDKRDPRAWAAFVTIGGFADF